MFLEFLEIYCIFRGYCSRVVFREVFFVSEGHRKPEGSRRQNGQSAHFVCIMLL